jgi:hypothetical protein
VSLTEGDVATNLRDTVTFDSLRCTDIEKEAQRFLVYSLAIGARLHDHPLSTRNGLVSSGVFMSCLVCASFNQVEFPAEMNIHLPGIISRNKAGVWLFPKILVCLDCGSSLFAVPKAELSQLCGTDELLSQAS